MNRFRIALSILGAAILGLVAARVSGQVLMLRPVEVSLMSFPITVSAGDYALINSVLDLPVGAGLPQHYHSGPVVVTVGMIEPSGLWPKLLMVQRSAAKLK